MDHILDTTKLKTVLLYELIGTAVITYAFELSDNNSLARAVAFFIMYILASHISGAHFNPAITFACYLSDRLAGKHVTS